MSNPSNLYELCEEVCEAIMASPTNYSQLKYTADAVRMWPREAEACGTAYCRAGWMVALVHGRIENPTIIQNTAASMLLDADIPGEDVTALFRASAVPYSGIDPVKHAKAGVIGMREFMTKHEDKLRSAKLRSAKLRIGAKVGDNNSDRTP